MTYLILLTVTFCPLLTHEGSCSQDRNSAFTIVTDGCTIPGVPEESEFSKIVAGPVGPANCDGENLLLESNATHIWIQKYVAYIDYNVENEDALYCCYSNFSAFNHIQNISYSDCLLFFTSIKALHEFVRVKCFYLDSEIYMNYFVFTVDSVKPNININKRTLNVLVLGLEGVSRLNFKRTMPETNRFLSTRGAIELRGYNKVGDNSFPNLFPLLTGKEFSKCKRGECEFIWERFKKAGFYTALGSDSAAGVLDGYEYGWGQLPADYYLQPFMYETRRLFEGVRYLDVYRRRCLRNQLFYQILLNYVKGLTQILKHNKLFGFFWEESVSHDFLISNPRIMDEGYFEFLTTLDDAGYLDKTILIFLSDHGARWGKDLLTRQGHLESRLPIFTILFPKVFKTRYKDAYHNFKNNSYRLVTPYDVFQTLADLVNPSSLVKSRIRQRVRRMRHRERSLSLFLPVPGNRTCAAAGVAEQWCACSVGTAVPAQRHDASVAASELLAYINENIQSYPQCHKLTLRKVLSVTELKETNENITYTIIMETTPGGGTFEGQVRRERSQWAAFGVVTRLNRYGDQSRCVDNPSAKLYCFCSHFNEIVSKS